MTSPKFWSVGGRPPGPPIAVSATATDNLSAFSYVLRCYHHLCSVVLNIRCVGVVLDLAAIPYPPTNLHAYDVTSRSITLSWNTTQPKSVPKSIAYSVHYDKVGGTFTGSTYFIYNTAVTRTMLGGQQGTTALTAALKKKNK